MTLRLKDLSIVEQVVLALSLVLLGFLLFDPFMLERSRALAPEERKAFKAVTDIGKSNWMLIPTGAAIALALVLRQRNVGFRNAAGYGLIASTIGFVFVSVGGAGLIAYVAAYFLVPADDGSGRPANEAPSRLATIVGAVAIVLAGIALLHASFGFGFAWTLAPFGFVECGRHRR